MKLIDVIDQVDELRPNNINQGQKVAWISEVEGLLYREIILRHEHEEEDETFRGYNSGTSYDQELKAPFPYDGLYIHYVLSKIDSVNLEFDKFNIDRAQFEQEWDTFGDFWTRTHMPLQTYPEILI